MINQNVTRSFVPSTSYTFTMIIGLIAIGICFICSLCLILIRTIHEHEKRERKATNLHRFIINLPEMDLEQWQSNGFQEKDLPIGYGKMMSMLGKSIKDIDDFKEQLQSLPVKIAEKLGTTTGNDQIEHLKHALAQNQFHF